MSRPKDKPEYNPPSLRRNLEDTRRQRDKDMEEERIKVAEERRKQAKEFEEERMKDAEQRRKEEEEDEARSQEAQKRLRLDQEHKWLSQATEKMRMRSNAIANMSSKDFAKAGNSLPREEHRRIAQANPSVQRTGNTMSHSPLPPLPRITPASSSKAPTSLSSSHGPTQYHHTQTNAAATHFPLPPPRPYAGSTNTMSVVMGQELDPLRQEKLEKWKQKEEAKKDGYIMVDKKKKEVKEGGYILVDKKKTKDDEEEPIDEEEYDMVDKKDLLDGPSGPKSS